MDFAWVVVNIFDFALLFIHSSVSKITRRRNSQQKKEPEAILSATDLIDMDISKISELEFRITIIKLLAGLEKSIKETRES